MGKTFKDKLLKDKKIKSVKKNKKKGKKNELENLHKE